MHNLFSLNYKYISKYDVIIFNYNIEVHILLNITRCISGINSCNIVRFNIIEL